MRKKNKKEIRAKKEQLKQIFLKSDINFDPIIYRFLDKDILDNMLSFIDDEPVPCNVDPDDLTSADEQFLLLLNRLIVYFRNNFPKIYNYTDYAIETIISGNFLMAENYLSSKHYIGDNNYIDFFNQSIWQLLAGNFISNGKRIPEVRSLLKLKKIKFQKSSKDYSLNELKKIIELLSDLVYCSSSEYHAFYLFGDIDTDLCKRLQVIEKERKYTLDEVSKHSKSLEEFYSTQYEILIHDYLKKQKYLKYFK